MNRLEHDDLCTAAFDTEVEQMCRNEDDVMNDNNTIINNNGNKEIKHRYIKANYT